MRLGRKAPASQYPLCPEHEPAETTRRRLTEYSQVHANLNRFRFRAEQEIRSLPDSHPKQPELLHQLYGMNRTPNPAQISDLLNACEQAQPGMQQQIIDLAKQDIADRNADFHFRQEYERSRRNAEHRRAERTVSRAMVRQWLTLCLMLAATIAGYAVLTLLRRAYLAEQPWLDLAAGVAVMLALAYPAYHAGRMFSDLRHGGLFQPKCRCPWAAPDQSETQAKHAPAPTPAPGTAPGSPPR